MAASTITYGDKTASASPSNPATELVRAVDLNEIKTVVNANASETDEKVEGPASATDNAVVVYDGTTGKLVKDADAIVTFRSQSVTGVNQLTLSGSLLGDQSLRGYRPIGATVTTSADLTTACSTPNTFYSVDASAGAITITVDDGEAAAVTAGWEYEFFVTDATNSLTFATGGSQSIVSKDSNLSLSSVGSAAVLKYLGSNVWALIGDLA